MMFSAVMSCAEEVDQLVLCVNFKNQGHFPFTLGELDRIAAMDRIEIDVRPS